MFMVTILRKTKCKFSFLTLVYSWYIVVSIETDTTWNGFSVGVQDSDILKNHKTEHNTLFKILTSI